MKNNELLLGVKAAELCPFLHIKFFQDKHANFGQTNHKDLEKQARQIVKKLLFNRGDRS